MGSLFGIPIRLHWTFLVLLYLLVSLGSPWAILALFGSVLLHELGHSLVARRFGIRVIDITFWPLGGMARMNEIPEVPRIEGLVAIAGPAVNYVLAAISTTLAIGLGALGIEGSAVLVQFTVVNLLLGTFNLIPAFPMDGGRILRAWFARTTDWVTATQQAVMVGRVFAALMFFGPILLMFVMPQICAMPLIAVFVWVAGGRELMAVRMRHGLNPFGGRGPFGSPQGPGGSEGVGGARTVWQGRPRAGRPEPHRSAPPEHLGSASGRLGVQRGDDPRPGELPGPPAPPAGRRLVRSIAAAHLAQEQVHLAQDLVGAARLEVESEVDVEHAGVVPRAAKEQLAAHLAVEPDPAEELAQVVQILAAEARGVGRDQSQPVLGQAGEALPREGLGGDAPLLVADDERAGHQVPQSLAAGRRGEEDDPEGHRNEQQHLHRPEQSAQEVLLEAGREALLVDHADSQQPLARRPAVPQRPEGHLVGHQRDDDTGPDPQREALHGQERQQDHEQQQRDRSPDRRVDQRRRAARPGAGDLATQGDALGGLDDELGHGTGAGSPRRRLRYSSPWSEPPATTRSTSWPDSAGCARSSRDPRRSMGSWSAAELLELPRLYRHACSVVSRLEARGENPRLAAEARWLVQRAHDVLYRHTDGQGPGLFARVFDVLARQAPRAIRSEWRLLALTFCFIYGLALIAWFSVSGDLDLAPSLLSPQMVENEISQLQSLSPDEPFRGNFTFGLGESPVTAGAIILNNLGVGVLFFASALLPPFYAYLLATNGLMLGTYTGVADHWDQAGAISSILWCHGVIEIQAFVLAGTAGLSLVRAWIRPGPWTRKHALLRESRHALVLLAPVLPLLLIAGLIEGFVSPHAPIEVRLATAVGTGIAMVAWALLGGRGANSAAALVEPGRQQRRRRVGR